MKVAISLILTSFICLVLFLAFSGPWAQLTDIIDEEAESHLDEEYYDDMSDSLNIYQWAFGLSFILFMISGVVAAFVESHRKEAEEYRYYDEYR